MNARTRSTLALVVLLTLAGFALRFYRLNSVPIRGDEVFTIRYWMRQPLAMTLANNATADPHPPLAYALFRAWYLVTGGDQPNHDQLARMLPALLNTLGIPAMYALGRRLGGQRVGGRVGVIAALLWAIHPYQLWHAQDARNYAIWAAFSAAALWLGLRAVQNRRPVDWALYVVVAALAAYTYYLELFILLALNLYVFIAYGRDRKLLFRWIGSQVAIGLLLAPWFLQPRLLTGSGYSGTSAIITLDAAWSFLPTLNFGAAIDPALHPLITALVAGAVALCAAALWPIHPRMVLLSLLVILLPLVLLTVISLRLNVFTPRYVLATSPAYLLLIAGALANAIPQGIRNRIQVPAVPRRAGLMIAALVVPLWLYLVVGGVSAYFTDPQFSKSRNWPALVAYLQDHVERDDIVIQAAADEALNYYYEQAGFELDRKQLPANPQQPVDEITALLEADRQAHRSIWRVGQTFPDWPNYGVVEDWLDEHMQRAQRLTVAGLRVERYFPGDVRPDERLAAEPLARFGNVVTLASAAIEDQRPHQPSLGVMLYWIPSRQTEVAYGVTVQLIGTINPDTGSPLWTQDDRALQDGRITTQTWEPDAIYRDWRELALPDGLPAGDYRIIVAVYDRETGERVPVGDDDHVVIGTVTIP